MVKVISGFPGNSAPSQNGFTVISQTAIRRAIAMNAHPAGKAGMVKIGNGYPHTTPILPARDIALLSRSTR